MRKSTCRFAPRRNIAIHAAIPTLIALGWLGCGADANARLDTDFNEHQIKKDILARSDLPAANALEILAEASGEDSSGLADPAAVVYTTEGSVLAVESQVHRVLHFPSSLTRPTTLVQSSPTDELLYPSRLRLADECFWLRDARMLRRYDLRGNASERLRTFYAMHDFEVLPEGGFVINPRFPEWAPDKPLLVQLDANGRKIRGFGQRSRQRRWSGRDNDVFLSRSEETLAATFRHQPRFQIFQLDTGRLAMESGVEHPVFPVFEEMCRQRLQSETRDAPAKLQLPRYLAGARILGDSLWILLHLPHLEVAEYGLDGRLRSRLRASQQPFEAAEYRGFDVRGDNGRPRFVIALIEEGTSLPRIVEARPSSAPQKMETGS